MIPKIIHYCWFGGNPLPKLAKKCIKSWKKYCKDYEIIEWNENNFDIDSAPLYVRQAYEAKKWAFVTDYVRLKVVYENGGIYLDTDVELLKSLDDLLNNEAYFGFEDEKHVATGLGFGAVKGFSLLKEMMEDYEEIPFVKEDGTFDTMPCPKRNTVVLVKNGLIQDGSLQKIAGATILPKYFLCPIDYETNKKEIKNETISIHWFSASWWSKELEKRHKRSKKEIKKANRNHFLKTIPNRLLKRLIGAEYYEKFKTKFK